MEDFDWVAARLSCSLGAVFEKLKADVAKDVEARETSLPTRTHYAFKFFPASITSFSAIAEGNKIRCVVEFTLGDGMIQVRGDGFAPAPSLDVTLTLNEQGNCRAKIKGEQLEFWQVRQRALEELFFRSY